eukprot:EC692831.1.p2 GENE.EC692831.1~~EC692831.1.p2  ORF type:complete len:199 (+),score=25.97 EC692831.1:136-732(+)
MSSSSDATASPQGVLRIQGIADYFDGKRFRNPWSTWEEMSGGKKFRLIFKFMFSRTPKPRFPLHAPDWARLRSPPRGLAQALWIGHATFFLQMCGLNILTDPVFSYRCSPVRFAGPSRMVKTPCKIKELPKVDVVIISHNHYDHLDTRSVAALEKYHQPTYFVPLKVGTAHLQKWVSQRSASWSADGTNRLPSRTSWS